jgi:hypothetical protein
MREVQARQQGRAKQEDQGEVGDLGEAQEGDWQEGCNRRNPEDQQEVRGVCWKHVRSHVKEGKQTIYLQAFDTVLGNHSECDP